MPVVAERTSRRRSEARESLLSLSLSLDLLECTSRTLILNAFLLSRVSHLLTSKPRQLPSWAPLLADSPGEGPRKPSLSSRRLSISSFSLFFSGDEDETEKLDEERLAGILVKPFPLAFLSLDEPVRAHQSLLAIWGAILSKEKRERVVEGPIELQPCASRAFNLHLNLDLLPLLFSTSTENNNQDLNPLPLVLMLGNAAGWVAYSVATTPPDIYIFLCNALGTLLGLFYTVSAVSLAADSSNSTEAESKRTVNVIAGTALASSALIMACGGVQAFLPSMTAAQHELMWGSAANLILIAFFSSPLSSLAHVLKTRCSATVFANWPLSVVSTGNSALWTAYGLAIGRPFVWAPNAFGCVLGVVQLLLCALLPTKVADGRIIAPASSGNKAGSPKVGDKEDSPRLVAVSMRVTPAARAGAAGNRVAPLEGGSNSGLSSRSGSGSGGGGIGGGDAGGRSLSRAWSAGQWSAAPGQPSGESTTGVRQLWTRLSNSFGSRGGGRNGGGEAPASAVATNSRRRLRGAGGRDSAVEEASVLPSAPVAVGTVESVDVEAAARR